MFGHNSDENRGRRPATGVQPSTVVDGCTGGFPVAANSGTMEEHSKCRVITRVGIRAVPGEPTDAYPVVEVTRLVGFTGRTTRTSVPLELSQGPRTMAVIRSHLLTRRPRSRRARAG